MSERWRIPNSKPWITDGDREYVADRLYRVATGEFEYGSEVAAFERELAEFLGRKYVVCVSSGTVALELALTAALRGPSTLSIESFGFIATANAAERAVGKLKFRDGGHVLGEVEPMPDGDHYAVVIDACQAFGAKLPPSLADCYSFNWNKPVTCLGGGCVATDDYELSVRVRELANQGRTIGECGYAYAAGTNARLSDMQAALGRSQLRRVGEILERRKQIAEWYWRFLGVIPPAYPRESWFLYPIELSNRDEVHAKMLERGIQTRSCADWLLPKHPFYSEKYGYARGDFPEAERRADRTLLLPLFPEMTLEQVQEICSALEQCGAVA